MINHLPFLINPRFTNPPRSHPNSQIYHRCDLSVHWIFSLFFAFVACRAHFHRYFKLLLVLVTHALISIDLSNSRQRIDNKAFIMRHTRELLISILHLDPRHQIRIPLLNLIKEKVRLRRIKAHFYQVVLLSTIVN